MTREELTKRLLEEEEKIKLWAKNVCLRLGEDFTIEFVDSSTFQDLFVLCNFRVKTTLGSKLIKEVIREEAEPFREGRLYFPVYSDTTKMLHLLFYSYYLLRRGQRIED